MKLFKTILNIIAIASILLLPYTGIIPSFGYSIPILVIVWFALKYSNESFADIGFSLKHFEPKSILIGAVVAALTLFFMQLAFLPGIELIASLEYKDSGLTDTIQEGPVQYLVMVVFGWLIGGIYEEIVFHGFIFTRLEKMIQGKYAIHTSFVITAILFGAYHYVLGPLGIINAFVIGIVYLALYLYFNRNLWYPIMCHGFYNMMVMTLIYFDYL